MVSRTPQVEGNRPSKQGTKRWQQTSRSNRYDATGKNLNFIFKLDLRRVFGDLGVTSGSRGVFQNCRAASSASVSQVDRAGPAASSCTLRPPRLVARSLLCHEVDNCQRVASFVDADRGCECFRSSSVRVQGDIIMSRTTATNIAHRRSVRQASVAARGGERRGHP